ncbi:amino acid ABC transporter permease [Nocardioides sp. InS609-2]|uniref:amino acid ABC transporter permease n=1 Tax=Nocardioides sp. InS609-2 TaxID=2760705 RepID=UPI00183D4AED|nr:amino acid ABC transporter permease [Nocardioides sp. InS609-2]MBA3780866.1 amino acid ABC transporter permease [Nocardioides sp.]
MEAFTTVLEGLPLTLWLTFASFAIGAVGAIPLALGLRSRCTPVRMLCRLLVDFVRGVPIIVWLFVLKFGLTFGTFRFTPVQAAILGLGVVSAAYLAEIYRGGLQTVPAGQLEAAQALGLSRSTAFGRIEAPQGFRIVSPSVATYLIGLFKDTAIASTIIAPEMVFQAQSFARQNPDQGLITYGYAGLLYIVLSLPVAYFARRLDRRLREAAH